MGDKLGKGEKTNKIKALRKRRERGKGKGVEEVEGGGRRWEEVGGGGRERTLFYNLRPDLLI